VVRVLIRAGANKGLKVRRAPSYGPIGSRHSLSALTLCDLCRTRMATPPSSWPSRAATTRSPPFSSPHNLTPSFPSHPEPVLYRISRSKYPNSHQTRNPPCTVAMKLRSRLDGPCAVLAGRRKGGGGRVAQGRRAGGRMAARAAGPERRGECRVQWEGEGWRGLTKNPTWLVLQGDPMPCRPAWAATVGTGEGVGAVRG